MKRIGQKLEGIATIEVLTNRLLKAHYKMTMIIFVVYVLLLNSYNMNLTDVACICRFFRTEFILIIVEESQ